MRGKNTPERKVASTGNQTQTNSSPLSHPGGPVTMLKKVTSDAKCNSNSYNEAMEKWLSNFPFRSGGGGVGQIPPPFHNQYLKEETVCRPVLLYRHIENYEAE